MADLIHQAQRVFFPGYFTRSALASSNLEHFLKEDMRALYNTLVKQIIFASQHDCMRQEQICVQCEESSRTIALQFIQALPDLREVLATDVSAAIEGDPAAKSFDEVITSYPGLFAITVQRLAHLLYKLEVPRLPRAMTEYAHRLTGIDIHPGARIGNSFFIDNSFIQQTGGVYRAKKQKNKMKFCFGGKRNAAGICNQPSTISTSSSDRPFDVCGRKKCPESGPS